MTKLFRVFVAVALAFSALFAQPVWALTQYSPSDLSKLASGDVASLIETVGIGASHRPVRPASPLGLALGIEFGVEVSAITLPSEFKTALELATKSNVPAIVPLPRLIAHKGLPYRFDLGLSFIGYQGNHILGADVQWSVMDHPDVYPQVAVRVAGTWSKLFFMSTHTYDFQVLASKSLMLIEPYAGLGLQTGAGDLEVPLNVPGLPANVSGHDSYTDMHVFVGIPFSLMIVKFAAEYDYSFAKVSTFTGKVNLSF